MIKGTIDFPTVNDILAYDPCLAVRSGEILDALDRDFTILERRDWGGTILQFLFTDIEGNFCDEDPRATMILAMLADVEEALIKMGEIDSHFTYIVATPKPAS